jgi:hypothetical protein
MTSFATDIVPILQPYRANMTWRIDLLDYGAVKANAALLYQRMAGAEESTPMPPPPMPPIGPSDLAVFKRWLDEGCPR